MSEARSDATLQRVSSHVWRFADCEFDEMKRELRVGGRSVEIEAKPLEVLHQLLLHAGEVVTKDELLETVWPGVMVVDGSLATAISKLRKALRNEAMILTLPRVGYRLAVPVFSAATYPPVETELKLNAGSTVPGREQWRLIRRLDLSPANEVWLAQHPKTRELRVFKFASNQQLLRSLKREVTLARLLRGSLGERPEFVRVLEWNFDTPPFFVESEYSGPNLVEWGDQQGGLSTVPLSVRLELLASVAQAVADAHELDVLHKDLKPANILVTADVYGNPQVKVADFGSASLLSPARLGKLGITDLGFTQGADGDSDSLTGTMMYIAPEVLGGQSPTAVSDVYALGVMLYQLVVGDFRRPLAPGWETDVTDPLLREDIADAACGNPRRRLKNASELATRLRTLEERHERRQELARSQQRKEMATRRRAKLKAMSPWLVLAAVLLLGVAAVSLNSRRGSPPAVALVRTIAVLPFQNVGSDPAVDYLSLALPDEIATILSDTSGIAVVPFTTTSKYSKTDLNLQETAREMRVGTIVAGRFTRTGEQLHVTLEAVDVENNSVLWRDTIDAPRDNLIATQVQLSLKVRSGLLRAFGATQLDAGVQPKDDEAYELFLKSLAMPMDPGPNPEGIRLLERAVELDPTYPPAWMNLARRYYVEARYAGRDPRLIDRYEEALERALVLDPDYIAAGAGLVTTRVERGDLVAGYRGARNLLERRPDSANAHFVMSYVLRFAGLLEESARHCDRAFILDPQDLTSAARSCAVVYLQLGDYPRAVNYLNIARGSGFARALTIHMLVRQGKEREAAQMASPEMPQWASYDLLLAYVQKKQASDIQKLAAAIPVSEDPEANYFSAAHLAYVGQTDAAVSMMRRAIQKNYCSYPSIDVDPFFVGLRARSDFGELRAAAIQCQNRFLEQRRELGQ